MKRSMAAIAAASAAAGLLAAGAAGGTRQDVPVEIPPMNGAVLTERDAYLLLRPEFVAGPRIQKVVPSPNHDFLLIVRDTRPVMPPLAPPKPQAEISLVLYNLRTRRATTLWRAGATAQQNVYVQSVTWVPGTADVALVSVHSEPLPVAAQGTAGQTRILRVDARAGTVKTLALAAPEDNLVVGWSRPVAALASSRGSVRLLHPDTGAGRSFAVPEGTIFYTWQEEGQTLLGMHMAREADGKYKRTDYELDVRTGQVRELSARPKRAPRAVPQPETPPLRVVSGSGTLTGAGGVKASLTPLWLEGTAKEATGSALLAPDGGDPRLLKNAVLFSSQGALYAAPVERVDRLAFERLRREMMKRTVMSSAKQIGLGLMMYAQDYDENFPPTDGASVRDRILPYLKNESLFLNPETGQIGFTLNPYASTSLASFDAPATTVLGYLTGPGGRAVIFVDGHVRWEDGPGP